MDTQKTATEAIKDQMLADRRRIGADVLIAHIMDEINANNVECDMRGVHECLMHVLHSNGAHIMTDAERDHLGLEPLDAKGWSVSDKLKMEQMRFHGMAMLMLSTHSR